jgi:ADP-ribose pyrophosphatase
MITEENNMKTWKTLTRETVLQMGRFLRVEKLAVELPDGRVIPDWPWIITPDYVNVLAVTDRNEFLCFRQTKYAVEGISLAPVGGFVEPGESPLNAAKRELLEEMGFEAEIWTALGRFSVDANRGAGNANFFIAQGATKIAEPTKDDLEEQELVKLSRKEMLDSLKRGEFKSLGWVSCIALALHYLGSQEVSF